MFTNNIKFNWVKDNKDKNLFDTLQVLKIHIENTHKPQ